MKTLLFCTTYAVSSPQWDARFRKWWDFFTASKLERAQILMIDDGSPVLPAWRGIKLLTELTDRQPPEKTVLYHFADNLGRSDALVYPGWFRSFTFAAVYAHRYGFDKVVHVESDSFLFTERIIAYINGLTSGWTALWCPRWDMPENLCPDHRGGPARAVSAVLDGLLRGGARRPTHRGSASVHPREQGFRRGPLRRVSRLGSRRRGLRLQHSRRVAGLSTSLPPGSPALERLPRPRPQSLPL